MPLCFISYINGKKERQYLVNSGIVNILKKTISIRPKYVAGESDD